MIKQWNSTKKIKSHLVDKHELEIDEIYEGKERDNVPTMSNTSGNTTVYIYAMVIPETQMKGRIMDQPII